MQQIATGLDRVLAGNSNVRFGGAALGLVCHPASVACDFRHAAEVLNGRGDCRLAALFGPQHGARGDKQDNMIESEPFAHPTLGVPVHSLYSGTRVPTPEMLAGLDTLVFDLQDVGVRVYTYAWTMLLAMRACRDAGVRCVVLDRPNPIGGVLREGAVLDPAFSSFVGLEPIPLRHGLTIGELARLANDTFGIGCELEVVPCVHWKRHLWFDDTALPFVMPSPNIPTLDACVVYPGMVMIEGTNLSEGRGTTRPFELFGAPYLDAERVAATLNAQEHPGVRFRACEFEPTFQKHAGSLCGGAQIHVTDRATFRPVTVALSIVQTAARLAPDAFAWREPPYEYEERLQPIDLLWGSDALRRTIDADEEVDGLLADAASGVRAFAEEAEPYLLYGV